MMSGNFYFQPILNRLFNSIYLNVCAWYCYVSENNTRQISGYPLVTLYINSEVAVQRCYMIITSGMELVKLGNECL